MRNLKSFSARAGVLLMTLLLALFTPLVAAASAAEAVPHMGPGGIFTTVAAAGLGIGAVMLKAKDATGTPKKFMVDTEKQEEAADAIEQYAELKAEEVRGPLQATITRLSAELKLLREKMAGEILRVRQLTEGEAFDLESERAYLLGDETKGIQPLQTERLVLEFERTAPKADKIKLKATTTGDAPQDPNDPYAALTAPATI